MIRNGRGYLGVNRINGSKLIIFGDIKSTIKVKRYVEVREYEIMKCSERIYDIIDMGECKRILEIDKVNNVYMDMLMGLNGISGLHVKEVRERDNNMTLIVDEITPEIKDKRLIIGNMTKIYNQN